MAAVVVRATPDLTAASALFNAKIKLFRSIGFDTKLVKPDFIAFSLALR